MNVYVFGDYEEHGLENVEATVTADRLPQLLEQFSRGYAEADRDHARASLRELLQAGEIACGKYNLMAGWGGVQLYVIRIA